MKFIQIAIFGVASAIKLKQLEEAAAEQAFAEYCAQYGYNFTDADEYALRKELYEAMEAEIQAINADASNTWEAGHNHLSILTEEEYEALLGHIDIPASDDADSDDEDETISLAQQNTEGRRGRGGRTPQPTPTPSDDSTYTVNWVTAGAVTSVKNQGQCGSCWTFSTAGALEGAHQIATGQLENLSEQQLVSCANGRWGNRGCNGGNVANAFNYTKKNPLELDSDYPYTSGKSQQNGTCSYNKADGEVSASSYVSVTPGDLDGLQNTLMSGPVSIAVDAGSKGWQSYRSGILNQNCGTDLDHAVLLVGYGTDGSQEFWLVKNSWGTGWGEQGYIRIAASSANVCGVLSYPVQPQV